MDIDIDTRSKFDPINVFEQTIPASMVTPTGMTKHPVGVYFQRVNQSPFNLACVPYKIAPAFGMFKVDFLHLSLLDHFSSKDEVRQLASTDPDWRLLEDEGVVSSLFQLHGHFDVVDHIKPRSVQELADCIALIRPGKRQLVQRYHDNPTATRQELYKLPLPKGCFKKAHAIAYALNVIIQLHLIERVTTGIVEF